MTDLKLTWDADAGEADLSIEAGDLAHDDGLQTAILISLFSDRRAHDDDPLADDGDRRGWWGDAFAEVEGDRIGSRLWELERLAPGKDRTNLFVEICNEALAWLVEDGVASSVVVTASIPEERPTLIAYTIAVTRPGQTAPKRFDAIWEAV